MIITTAANDRIKKLTKLLKSSRERRKSGCFIVEGIRMFREIPKERLKEIYVAESKEEKFLPYLEEYKDRYVVVSDKVFDGISDTETPQGIMGVVATCNPALEDLLSTKDNISLFVVEKLQDPGNLGTIIRMSEGAGITGIVLSSDSVDIYNPKVVRSTMGSIFRVPIYISENLTEDITVLKEKNITVYGAHLDGTNLYDNDFTGNVAFLIGNEGNGLTAEVSSTSDKLLRIPMMGNVESLNAAVSATVIGYEVLRQRNFA